jgi:hypothetical protein
MQQAMQKALNFALAFDHEEVAGDVRAMRAKYPSSDRDKLVDRQISRTRWKSAAVGFGTGLPANPWVMVPAAILDVGTVLRMEVTLAARIALLYDPDYLADGETPYELMVPIMGGRLMSEFVKELGVRGGMGVARQTIRKVLTKQALRQFQRIMLKYFGMKVTQKAVITKTLPVVGGVIGGGWNFLELKIVGGRIRSYFDGAELAEEHV